MVMQLTVSFVLNADGSVLTSNNDDGLKQTVEKMLSFCKSWWLSVNIDTEIEMLVHVS